jgi:hypothetical protein
MNPEPLNFVDWILQQRINADAEWEAHKATGQANREAASALMFEADLMGSAMQCAATAASFNQRGDR